ncbi:MAG: hypothetical protein KGL39_52630, partial [Patescibacteria group bacterium]|nr:hypothetical protein [Patescibacteria group bacterium]
DPIIELLWDRQRAEEEFSLAVSAVEDVAKGNFHRDHIGSVLRVWCCPASRQEPAALALV